MKKVYDNCCGIDVHKKLIVACFKQGSKQEVREFGATTRELLKLCGWLKDGDCEMVAMESTASFWKPLYNSLEASELDAIIVNARHMKNVPGRKTDVKDAEWIADLLQHGLLQASYIPDKDQRELRELVRYRKCISISKHDWDSNEKSWDFNPPPLIRNLSTIAEAFDQWKDECDNRFNKLKANEEEHNRIFIDIYGLQDELTPEVEDKDVIVRKADLGRDIRSFVSYAVGCMFGRYSLDVDGLVYAGGEWEDSQYSTFKADEDNIIPISDDEYFEDDIIGRFVKFVEVIYGKDTLQENLKFIANALGGKGQPREVIRNYFLIPYCNCRFG